MSENVAAMSRAANPVGNGGCLRSLDVLYVEDDDEVRDQLAHFLGRRVGRLHLASNGAEGLEVFRKHRPDLVITDILMPVMDGLAMADAIRTEDDRTPIIVTTAFERQDYMLRSIEAGIDKYVIKPVRPDQLIGALEKCASALHAGILARESQERYRMMFQSFRVGICIVAADGAEAQVSLANGYVVDCNRTFLDIVGYEHLEDLSRVPYSTLIPVEQRQAVGDLCAVASPARGAIREYEREFLRRDGGRVPVLVQSLLRRDAEGRVYELWDLVTDITERKRSQQQLHLAAKVFEGAGEAIIITDGQCRIISVNKAFCQITGYLAEDVHGENPRILGAGIQNREFYADMWAQINSTGAWRGEVWNRRKSGEVFPEWLSITALVDAGGQATHYIGIFSDITERKRTEERIRFLVQHDVLTGLPNRLLLRDRLEHAFACATRDERKVAVLCVDLDHFKTINDSLGHRVGDMLLQQVSARMAELLRAVDTISRQGGDEFIIILNGVVEDADAARVAEKLREVLAEPFRFGERELDVSCSIGISVYPRDGMDAETLIKSADTAMYLAKENGRDNHQFFKPSLNQAASERLSMEGALRRAISGGELEVYFQPQISLTTGGLSGAEALLRWNHPQLGFLSPARFIPLAEERGLIGPIGEWVLTQVCRLASDWRRAGLDVVPLAVNLSPVQLRGQNILARLTEIVAAAGLPADSIEIELTESALMEDIDSSSRLMRGLSDHGISLAIDDFGTGYSNLGYLKRYFIDKLKIDKSFLEGIPGDQDSQVIVSAIIKLAKNLGMQVIAEGVEQTEQVSFLSAQGCDQAQGYFFARPMPAAEFVKLLPRT